MPNDNLTSDSESASRLMDLTNDSERDRSFTFSFDGVDWNDGSESIRRFRAKVVANHAKDNYELSRSEFAWDADAWRDVFGKLRYDNLIAMDKRSYFGVKDGFKPTDLPADKGSFEKKTPDMTFGLKPLKSQNWLQDARLHPDYGLIADPKWDDMSLLFPFMVYEAKARENPASWSNLDNEAWEQGHNAGCIYLALQESLIRVPGSAEKINRPLQFPPFERCDPCCFVLTSVGATWTIYTISPTEDHEQTFYTWSRMDRYKLLKKSVKRWEGDVRNERSAWELLCVVDRIQQWATNSYRAMIQHYLKSWHDAVEKDILFEWKMGEDGQRYRLPREEDINSPGWSFRIPKLTMPFWAMAVTKEWREKLCNNAHKSFMKAYNTEEGRELKKTWRQDRFCQHKDVGSVHFCNPEDKDFVKKWLAGPGRRWQKPEQSD